MNTRKILPILLAFTLSTSLAQKPNKEDVKRAKELKKHVTFLASEALEGRRSGTSGEAKAAEYIASEFKKIGLEPITEDDYYQRMPVVNMRMAQGNTSLLMDGETLNLFTQYYPLSESANNARYKGKAINVGTGIVDDGLKRDDYQDKDVAGMAVIIDLTLPGSDAKEKNKYASYEGVDLRIQIAKSKGVKAILFHTMDEDYIPSGELAKIVSLNMLPILFIKKDLTKPSYNVDLVVSVIAMSVDAQNVIGKINNNAESTIVIASHYDYLGKGIVGVSSPEYKGDIHYGADDNASGVAALLMLAKQMKASPKLFQNHNYLFIAFTGNNQDLMGSKHFLRSTMAQKSNIKCMLSIEKIGHLDSTEKQLMINAIGTSPSWKEVLDNTKYATKKIAKVKTSMHGLVYSDHAMFYRNSTPVVYITTGDHRYHQTPDDTAETLNYLGQAYVAEYLCSFMTALDKVETMEYRETSDDNALNGE